LMKSSVLPPAL